MLRRLLYNCYCVFYCFVCSYGINATKNRTFFIYYLFLLTENNFSTLNMNSTIIKKKKFLPDLPELITPPVSSQDDDDDLLSSSAPLKIDSSDVQRLFEEPAFLLIRFEFISFMGLVCVDIDLHVPFVMEISSKSSSIFNTGKWFWWPDTGKSYGLEYFSNTSRECFRFPLDDACNGRSFGRSTLNECNGIYVCEYNKMIQIYSD